MSERQAFFVELWEDFVAIAPVAAKIKQAFERRGETVQNDHVAFRTFNTGPLSLSNLEPLITELAMKVRAVPELSPSRLRAPPLYQRARV